MTVKRATQVLRAAANSPWFYKPLGVGCMAASAFIYFRDATQWKAAGLVLLLGLAFLGAIPFLVDQFSKGRDFYRSLKSGPPASPSGDGNSNGNASP